VAGFLFLEKSTNVKNIIYVIIIFMKKFLIIVVVLFLIICSFSLYVFYFNADILNKIPYLSGLTKVELKPLILKESDVSNVTKPAIVSIYQHIVGKVVIPYFDIDINKLELVFPPNHKPAAVEEDVDNYLRGSGYIVSKDGYIVTNAHVASKDMAKASFAAEYLKYRLDKMTVAEETQLGRVMLSRGIKEVDARQFGEDFGKSLARQLIEKIVDKTTSTLVVLNPASSGDRISDLIGAGFPAKLVYVNNNFIYDEKDIAVLKIEKDNLPTVTLADSDNLSSGNKIYVYGFPSSGQFNSRDVLEPTFTSGTVSNLKDSNTKEFKTIQTEAKVSPGSSGGPLFNDQGQVAGMLTYASTAADAGDAFAFAIPVSLVKNVLNNNNIAFNENKSFPSVFKNGLLSLQNSQCKKSIEDLKTLKNTDKDFSSRNNIQTYIDECNQIIASGNSIDSAQDVLRLKLSKLGFLFWSLLGLGIIIVLVIIWVFIKMAGRIKKDEALMDHLENDHNMNNNQINYNPGNNQVYPQSGFLKPIDPNLLNYVHTARASGLNNDFIISNLRTVGWKEEDIIRAVNS